MSNSPERKHISMWVEYSVKKPNRRTCRVDCFRFSDFKSYACVEKIRRRVIAFQTLNQQSFEKFLVKRDFILDNPKRQPELPSKRIARKECGRSRESGYLLKNPDERDRDLQRKTQTFIKIKRKPMKTRKIEEPLSMPMNRRDDAMTLEGERGKNSPHPIQLRSQSLETDDENKDCVPGRRSFFVGRLLLIETWKFESRVGKSERHRAFGVRAETRRSEREVTNGRQDGGDEVLKSSTQSRLKLEFIKSQTRAAGLPLAFWPSTGFLVISTIGVRVHEIQRKKITGGRDEELEKSGWVIRSFIDSEGSLMIVRRRLKNETLALELSWGTNRGWASRCVFDETSALLSWLVRARLQRRRRLSEKSSAPVGIPRSPYFGRIGGYKTPDGRRDVIIISGLETDQNSAFANQDDDASLLACFTSSIA
ncbi:hypothetical protein SCHPADRAFT_895818 [Schizopora paradoxa]|uniref:Uncharacterized protein n=1 Tax=Schizopora paradoxa TaxID=27342 RepID=A0A0H2R2J5_9AGAM|nr:hypothetical protein SCHPADRAFT_895818 [Schizopora paradoxa]